MKLERQLVCVGDQPNLNNHIYPTSVLKKVVAEFQTGLLGQIGMLQNGLMGDGTIALSDASHIVTKLWVEDNNLYADVKILDTPMGKTLATLLTTQPVVFRLSGICNYTEEQGVLTMADDYRLAAINAVPEDQAA